MAGTAGTGGETGQPPASGLDTTASSGEKSTATLLQRGDYVGRYLVLSRVGQGGMGIVYSAHDPELDRKVALKLLSAERGADSEGSARLLREAQALAKLSHPNVVSVHDVGTLGHRVWIAMEFIEGQTVAKWLREKRRGWREVLEVFLQAGEGLQAAHAAGFVHRDFKPENVMLTTDGRVKVMDFGLARIETSPEGGLASPGGLDELKDVALTRTGALVGTPRYMAPEQWEGANTDVRTDQFSFSVSLWEALLGDAPFRGETLAEIAVSVKQGRVRPPEDHAKVPAWLRDIVLRGLQVDPAARWPSMLAMLSSLRKDPTLRNRLIVLAVILTVVAGVVAVFVLNERARRNEQIESILAEVYAEMAPLLTKISDNDEVRRKALAAFDAEDVGVGERLWSRYTINNSGIERGFAQVARQLEAALNIDSGRDDVRGLLAGMLFRSALWIEQAGGAPGVVQDRIERIRLYDASGEYKARWVAPATVHVTSDPVGARVMIERFIDEDGRLRPTEAQSIGETPLQSLALDPGSYRIRLELAGRIPVLYPIAVSRSETVTVTVPLPPAEVVPPGFVYVPAGRFFYGSRDAEPMRRFLRSEPMHTSETGAYLIGATEVTLKEYIEFLAAEAPADREARLKAMAGSPTRLEERPGGGWRLVLNQGLKEYTAETGSPLVYEGRNVRASVEWERLPASGISSEDAEAYVRWLDRSGRVPGARFCDEREWERATRGADGRLFASGDVLHPTDANYDETYGRVASAFGPDPVGSYPHAASPFGLYDTDGNVYEMTASAHGDQVMVRGGAFFFSEIQARSTARFHIPPGLRDTNLGLRVCATWPPNASSE